MHDVCSANVKVASFPLKNETNDKIYFWISAVFPEMMSRFLFLNKDIQIYDPSFMFQTDSSICEMKSDSILEIHLSKWQWNIATGGRYKVVNDSIYLFLDVVLSSDEHKISKIEISESGPLYNYLTVFSKLILKVFSLANVQFSKDDSLQLKKKVTPFDEAYKTYLAGYLFEMKGNIPAALSAYSRSLEIDPMMVVASCRLGLLYSIQKKYDAAKSLFEKTLQQNPGDPWIISYMAEFLSKTEHYDIASQFIDKHRTYISKTSKGLRAAGNVYLRQGEYQRAIAILTQAIAAGSENLDSEFLIGQAWLHTGEYDRAIDIFNRLIKCRPDYLRYYSSLGTAYRKAGQLMQAAMTLQSALSREPRNITVMIDLSQIWIELKWYEKALQLLKQAEEINPEIGDIYINIGMAYWYCGDESAAQNYFNKAMNFSNVRQSALVNTGNMFFSKKEFKKAISLYKTAAKDGKHNASLEYNLAVSYFKLGKKKKAIQHFDALLTLAPDRIDILSQRAQLAIELGKYDEAEHFFRRILDISPQDTRTVQLLVDLYTRTKKYEEATKTLEELLAYLPSNNEFINLLAKVYMDREWFEVASEKYREIIRDFPDYNEGYIGLGLSMYELVIRNKADNYDEAIYALKFASQRMPDNPLPDELIGNVYFESKGYRELALDHWNKALQKTVNESEKKKLREKIRSVESNKSGK